MNDELIKKAREHAGLPASWPHSGVIRILCDALDAAEKEKAELEGFLKGSGEYNANAYKVICEALGDDLSEGLDWEDFAKEIVEYREGFAECAEFEVERAELCALLGIDDPAGILEAVGRLKGDLNEWKILHGMEPKPWPILTRK